MSRRERLAWCVAVLLLTAAARLPLHRQTVALPVSNDDAIPLMMAGRVLHGELSTILWNQPYNGTLDTYLLAPGLLAGSPHSVFRVYEALCGIALVALAGLLACAVAGERAGWMSALLAGVGTPYMGLMAALGPTPNFLVPLMVGVVVLAGYRMSGGAGPLVRIEQGQADVNVNVDVNVNGGKPFVIGAIAGLAIWDSFLALPALAGAAIGFILAGARIRLRALVPIVLGAGIGMFPLLIARVTEASGATPVTAMRPRWLWLAGLRDLGRAASGLFGLEVPLVVDGPERASLPLALAPVLGIALVALAALGSSRRRAWPLAGWAIALAAAFALSRRTGGDEVRYLFGLALPVLALCGIAAATLHARLGAPRRALVVTSVVLAAVASPWLVGHRTLLAAWRNPMHAAEVWQVPPLDPAIAALRNAGIRSAYASLQLAGRLTVESNGAVIASQAWNERIPGDPLRYRDEVDLDPRPAWVLSPHLSRGMPRSAGLRAMLGAMGGAWREQPAGAVEIFHDFRAPYDEGRAVPVADLTVSTAEGVALPASVADRHRGTAWTSPAGISRGSGIAVSLPQARRLSAVVLLLPRDAGLAGLRWVAEAEGTVIARGPDRFGLQWLNGAPRAGRQEVMVIPLGDRSVREARVLFQDPGPPLTIAEVFAYGPDEAAKPPAGAAAAAEAYTRFREGKWREAANLYAKACELDPDRVSHHAAALRAGRRAARRKWLDIESLPDGGPPVFAR